MTARRWLLLLLKKKPKANETSEGRLWIAMRGKVEGKGMSWCQDLLELFLIKNFQGQGRPVRNAEDPQAEPGQWRSAVGLMQRVAPGYLTILCIAIQIASPLGSPPLYSGLPASHPHLASPRNVELFLLEPPGPPSYPWSRQLGTVCKADSGTLRRLKCRCGLVASLASTASIRRGNFCCKSARSSRDLPKLPPLPLRMTISKLQPGHAEASTVPLDI